MASDQPLTSRPKPTVRQLGVDLASLDWQRSGAGDGSFEVAVIGRGRGEATSVGSASWSAERSAASGVSDQGTPEADPEFGQADGIGATTPKPCEKGSRGLAGAGDDAAEWVLLRVAGDPSGRVLVYDTAEWRYFVEGAQRGEFDAAPPAGEQAEPRRDSGGGDSQPGGSHGGPVVRTVGKLVGRAAAG